MQTGGIRRCVTALLLLGASVGCLSPRPILYPNAHLQSVGEESSKEDVQRCREVAKEAGDVSGAQKGPRDCGRTYGYGCARGSRRAAPSAERSQALQELAQRWAPPLGPPFAFLGGLFSSSPPDPAYVNVVNQCLAERGYEVAGWE